MGISCVIFSDNTPTTVNCELFVRSFGSPSPLTMVSTYDLALKIAYSLAKLFPCLKSLQRSETNGNAEHIM